MKCGLLNNPGACHNLDNCAWDRSTTTCKSCTEYDLSKCDSGTLGRCMKKGSPLKFVKDDKSKLSIDCNAVYNVQKKGGKFSPPEGCKAINFSKCSQKVKVDQIDKTTV